MRASLKGWGRRLWPSPSASPAPSPPTSWLSSASPPSSPANAAAGFETPEQAAERGKFDVALVAVLSDAGLRRSEASSLTWGDIQRWDDGSGPHHRHPLQDRRGGCQGAVVAITPAAMQALDASSGRLGVGGEVKVFGLSESQIARRVKAVAKAAGLAELGVLQRSQRARRHGPAHGPERRPNPRDRTTGPVEAGRRHGRPLHPRRDRRLGTAVSVSRTRL